MGVGAGRVAPMVLLAGMLETNRETWITLAVAKLTDSATTIAMILDPTNMDCVLFCLPSQLDYTSQWYYCPSDD